jgi:hydroxyacylglutathione hydrolase
MFLKKFTFGPLEANNYLIWDEERNCVIIDAGCYTLAEQQQLSSFILDKRLRPLAMLVTHAHLDHVLGAKYLHDNFRIRSWMHEEESYNLHELEFYARIHNINPELRKGMPDNSFSDGEKLCFGSICLDVIHIPAHTKGSVCFYEPVNHWLFTGDTLTRGSLCFTNEGYASLLNCLKQRLLVLPDDTRFFFGHGEDSSLAEEKELNAFFRRMAKKKEV